MNRIKPSEADAVPQMPEQAVSLQMDTTDLLKTNTTRNMAILLPVPLTPHSADWEHGHCSPPKPHRFQWSKRNEEHTLCHDGG